MYAPEWKMDLRFSYSHASLVVLYLSVGEKLQGVDRQPIKGNPSASIELHTLNDQVHRSVISHS